MPQKGQRSITIKDTVYTMAEDMATTDNRTVANYVKNLIMVDWMTRWKAEK
jgi:hypothetical protein